MASKDVNRMTKTLNLPEIVRQPYELTAKFVKFEFSTQENRILVRILQRVKVHQEINYSPQIDLEGNVELQFYWKDLLLENDNAKNNLEKALRALREKTIAIDSEMEIDGKLEPSTKLIGVIERPEWNRSRSHVRMRLDNRYYTFLTNLNKGYTEFVADNSFRLSGIYTIKFYYYIKQWYATGGRTLTLERFRRELEISPDKYRKNTVSAFRQKIIEPAKKDLDELADVSFNYTVIKEGRRVTGFSFKFYRTNNETPRKHSTENIEYIFDLLEPNFELSNETKSRLVGLMNKYQFQFLKSLINTHYFDISNNYEKTKDLPKAIHKVILDHYDYLFKKEEQS